MVTKNNEEEMEDRSPMFYSVEDGRKEWRVGLSDREVEVKEGEEGCEKGGKKEVWIVKKDEESARIGEWKDRGGPMKPLPHNYTLLSFSSPPSPPLYYTFSINLYPPLD